MELRGVEPLTSRLPVSRAPNCATAPRDSMISAALSTVKKNANRSISDLYFVRDRCMNIKGVVPYSNKRRDDNVQGCVFSVRNNE